MPRPSNQNLARVGKTIDVPAGWRGRCLSCGQWSETDGTECAVAMEGNYFNGKFSRGTGKLAVLLACPCCNQVKVEYQQN